MSVALPRDFFFYYFIKSLYCRLFDENDYCCRNGLGFFYWMKKETFIANIYIYSAWFSIYRHESLTRKINCYFFCCELLESVYPMEHHRQRYVIRHTVLDGQKSCPSTRTVTCYRHTNPYVDPVGSLMTYTKRRPSPLLLFSRILALTSLPGKHASVHLTRGFDRTGTHLELNI